MVFHDRKEAGLLLADKLRSYRGQDAVILGLPRGGLAVARPVADQLDLPLDIIVARKIGAPGNEELAIGAVTAHGMRVLNDRIIRMILLPPNYLEVETARQRSIASQREEELREGRPRIPLAGKIAIIVDDGIATGMTMRAAIADVRSQRPQSIVVAAPVMAPDAMIDLQGEVNSVIALELPERFYAVGQFYDDFHQVNDEEAHTLLVEHVS